MRHISDELPERYVLHRLSEPKAGPVEKHLLICEPCQDRLEAKIEFVTAMRAAATEFMKSRTVCESEDRLQLVRGAVGARGALCLHRAKWVIQF